MKAFESHVTTDPIFGERREQLAELAQKHGFQLAKLFMSKEEESLEDTFMTGHSAAYVELMSRMVDLVREARQHGFNVRRYKIEEIHLDSKYQDDPLSLLRHEATAA
jgi:hypothetical protein